MQFIPFISVGEFLFQNTIEEIKRLVKENFIIGVKEELDKKYLSLYIPVRGIFIVFSEMGDYIRTIEIENNVFFQEVNLFRMSFENIKCFIEENDKNYKMIDDCTLESKKYGFLITKKTDNSNTLTFYSKKYLQEDDISPNDIIKYYLG